MSDPDPPVDPRQARRPARADEHGVEDAVVRALLVMDDEGVIEDEHGEWAEAAPLPSHVRSRLAEESTPVLPVRTCSPRRRAGFDPARPGEPVGFTPAGPLPRGFSPVAPECDWDPDEDTEVLDLEDLPRTA